MKAAHFRAAGLLLWALLLFLASASYTAGQEWGTYRGGPSLEGAAEADFQGSPRELWRVLIGDPPSGTPVGGDGTLYAASDRGIVFAIGVNGREKWRAPAWGAQSGDREAESFTAPLLHAGDTLVIGSRSGNLYALNASTGEHLWRYEVGGPVFGPANLLLPAGGEKKSVVVLSQTDGTAHRIDLETGKRINTSPTTNRCDGAAAVRGETIAYGNCDAALYLLSARDLKVRRKIELLAEGQVYAGVALTDEAVYAGDRSGRLYAVSVADGEILWVNDEGRGDVSSAPAVWGSRVVYSTDDGAVACLEKSSGRTVWRTNIVGRPGAPVITTGGQVVVGSEGTLHLLRLRDGGILWSREVSDEITSPAIVENRIVVGSADGFVVAFGSPAQKKVQP